MAQTILQAIEGDAVLVAEAGTGTGKTLAYLVPALLAGGKVIVTTGTRTLQDQLYDRDLPAVRAALASGAVPALLKGRANYVCLHRLERAVGEARLASREEAQQLRRIERFAAATTSGDRADLPDCVEFWREISAASENCIGQSCPDFDACWVTRMRQQALEADLVVVRAKLEMAAR